MVVIPVTDAGFLERFGYSTGKSSRARHRAIAKAVAAHGSSRTWHELHAGYIRNMNDNPQAARVFAADRNYVSRHWGRGGR